MDDSSSHNIIDAYVKCAQTFGVIKMEYAGLTGATATSLIRKWERPAALRMSLS